jgi:uncharacterized lipoprotein YmbA
MSRTLRALALAVCALASAACSILPEPPAPVRYAVLVPAEELPGAERAGPAEPRRAALRVGLGPIALPGYLRRSELVSRAGTRLVPSETDRWAEPLERAVERVLAADLRHALGVGPIVPYPWYATERPDVQVEIAFSRFERDESGSVVADATWILRSLAGDRPPLEGRSVVTHPVDADGAASALGLSRALAEVAREIARAWPEE